MEHDLLVQDEKGITRVPALHQEWSELNVHEKRTRCVGSFLRHLVLRRSIVHHTEVTSVRMIYIRGDSVRWEGNLPGARHHVP